MSQLPPEVQHLAIQSAKGWAQARHPKKKEAFQKYLDSDPAAFNAITKVVYKSDIVAVPEAIGSATRVRRKFQRGHSTVTPQLL